LGARPATLGCGTLILIGIVVAIFTHSGLNKLEQRVTRLEHAVDSLQTLIVQQTSEIRQLRATLRPATNPAGAKAR
jgi:chaperonin cofactor prefoldin